MSLLDDLLRGLADQPATGRPMGNQPQTPQQQPGGSGMATVMKALLPMVLAMLANRGDSGQQADFNQRRGSAGGGLDDLIGSIFGGSSSGGGLGDLLSQFQRAGFGQEADSWVGRGRNMALPPQAVEQVFGRGGLAEIARRTGLSETDVSSGLSQLLPEVVDHVTPEGEVPSQDVLARSLEGLSRRYRLG
jgi:uncharacterized protein YidB (DUF937 family)